MTTIRKIRISNRINLEINHNDSATPAMVEANNWKYSATYDCAMDTNYVDDVTLTNAERATLEKYRDAVDEAYEIARKDDPDYN